MAEWMYLENAQAWQEERARLNERDLRSRAELHAEDPFHKVLLASSHLCIAERENEDPFDDVFTLSNPVEAEYPCWMHHSDVRSIRENGDAKVLTIRHVYRVLTRSRLESMLARFPKED